MKLQACWSPRYYLAVLGGTLWWSTAAKQLRKANPPTPRPRSSRSRKRASSRSKSSRGRRSRHAQEGRNRKWSITAPKPMQADDAAVAS